MFNVWANLHWNFWMPHIMKNLHPACYFDLICLLFLFGRKYRNPWHTIFILYLFSAVGWENMPWQHIHVHSNNLFLHCFVSDSEERPVVIQGKEIVCLLFHQPSLFETVIWWNVIQTSGPKDAVIYQSSLLFCIHQFVDIM